MSASVAAMTNTKEIGAEVIRALNSMNIPPKPEYYQVWFSHLESSNDALSTEIQSKIEDEGEVDEFFLKAIHEQYFELAHPPKQIERFAVEVLNETNALQQLSKVFDTNTKQFSSDLADASQSVGDISNDSAATTKLLNSLVDIAQDAISRNNQLENDLTNASKKIDKLQSSIDSIARDAKTDFLTKLNNRRYFDSTISHLITAATSEKTPLCMIVADIDHFKSFNDKWGHPVGDQVLKLVADVLQENVKGQDLLSRYGGEEFAIALPKTSLKDAETVADNIRVAVSKRKLINRANNQSLGRVSMSFGVAQLRDDWPADALYKAADAALYEAKQNGRNRVACWSDAEAGA